MALDLITGSADQPTSTAFVWDPLAQHRFNRDCFVLENVANLGLATWGVVNDARNHLAQQLNLKKPDDTCEHGRPPGATRFSLQFRGLITCKSCGNIYGQYVWHSDQSCPAYAWECLVNLHRRGTCGPPYVYETLLKMFLAVYLRELTWEDTVLPGVVASALVACRSGSAPNSAHGREGSGHVGRGFSDQW